MKLAVVVALATSGAVAHATTFDEYGEGQRPEPARQLYEAACDLDVDLRGAVAAVELRQRFVNGGPGAVAFVYEHELPDGAVVTGFAVKRKAAAEAAIAVPAGYGTARIGSPDVLGADPAVLRRNDEGRYEVTVQPIEADHEITLITRYAVAATPRAGALRLVMPGRSATGKLAACKGTVRATPGPATAIQRIRVGGIDSGKASAPFTVDDKPVALDVELAVAGKEPVVWTQTQPLADGWSASLVTVLAPRITAAGARRVVFVVDGSRSMELVGKPHVKRVVKALASALPAGAEVEAILYDRTAARVFGELRPATATNLAAIEAALDKRPAGNGSDVVQAFELARQVIAGTRGQAMVVVITDGVTGELPDQALVHALAQKTSTVDVHAIVLDPAQTRSPGAASLRSPVNLYGGAYVEVNVGDLDEAMGAIDSWLRPSWLELALGPHEVPSELRSGAGFTRLVLHRGAPAFTLTGHGDARFAARARPMPGGGVAALALASHRAAWFDGASGDDGGGARPGAEVLLRALAAYPSAEHDRALVVLASTGRIAKNRRAMIVGGGRYERMVAIQDPPRAPHLATVATATSATAIAKDTLVRMFREQLHPKAYACYQRALGTNAKLAGTAQFRLWLGRGEVTHVAVTGIEDAAMVACLVDAGYGMTAPFPDFSVNADDQTLAHYPLTFSRRADQAVVLLGDADSESPLDIDAIEGGVPLPPKRRVKVDAKTPLGGLRVPKQ